MTGGGWLRKAGDLHLGVEEAAQVTPGGPEPQGVGVGGVGLYGAPGGALGPPHPAQWEDPLNPWRRTLRSTEWDGPAPHVGDLMLLGDLAVIRQVSRGAGPGQWRLDVEIVDGGVQPLQHLMTSTVWQWRVPD